MDVWRGTLQPLKSGRTMFFQGARESRPFMLPVSPEFPALEDQRFKHNPSTCRPWGFCLSGGYFFVVRRKKDRLS